MPLSKNPFAVLGLKERFALDLQQLESKQREAYVARKNEGESALEAVNWAYRCLKAPVTRAQLLFTLRGWSTEIEPTKELLERVFFAREDIEQAKARNDGAFLLDWVGSARERHSALCESLGRALDDVDCAVGTAEREHAAALLEELRYLARALAEAESALGVLEEAALIQ